MLDRSNLLLDIGNTLIKFAWFKVGQDLNSLHCETIETKDLPVLLKDRPYVFICSVKSSEVTNTILDILDESGVEYINATTQTEQFGIKNSYTKVSNMGSDRWLAMLGADALIQSDLLVIDAGTAITCDFIVKKHHKGGWIAPGLSLLRQSVVKNTQRVFDSNDIQVTLTPGTDTPACVANGALAQLSGMVIQAIHLMSSCSSDFNIVLTGGDRIILRETLQKNPNALHGKTLTLFSNLVLVGLARMCANQSR